MNSYFKERYSCDRCNKQFHYKTDLYTHKADKCGALDEISFIVQNKYNNDVFSCCEEETDQSSSQLRNTSIYYKNNEKQQNYLDSFAYFERNPNKVNDTMNDTKIQNCENFYSKFNYFKGSNEKLNDTMIDHPPREKKKKHREEEKYKRSANDSFEDYFIRDEQVTEMKNKNKSGNSSLDDFYFHSNDNYQHQMSVTREPEDSLDNYKEYFYNL